MTLEERKYWIDSYIQFPTGNISDAMDSLGLARGAILGLSPLNADQPKTAGFALTIRQIRRRTPWDGKNLARQGEIIDGQAQEGDLLVIDMGDITEVCTGGAILALRAQMRGVTGEITNGCLRDAEEIAELNFPVLCKGTSPVKSAYDIETAGVNVPVSIKNVEIMPGDLILIDRTGAIAVPAKHLTSVLDAAGKIAARETKMTEMIRRGNSLAEARKAMA